MPCVWVVSKFNISFKRLGYDLPTKSLLRDQGHREIGNFTVMNTFPILSIRWEAGTTNINPTEPHFEHYVRMKPKAAEEPVSTSRSVPKRGTPRQMPAHPPVDRSSYGAVRSYPSPHSDAANIGKPRSEIKIKGH